MKKRERGRETGKGERKWEWVGEEGKGERKEKERE